MMTIKRPLHAATAITAFGVIVLAGMSFNSPHVKADDIEQDKVEIGLQLSPVFLHYLLTDKDQRALVGLGSYIVNAQADCNGCHNSPDLGGEFVTPTGNPYLLKPPQIAPQVNPAGYLGGGRDFGPYPGPGPWGNGPFAHIVARNLTPDITGGAVGGHSLTEFKNIMRTGHDYDGVHPTCGPGGLNGACLPAPFDGSKLQIMPWPTFAHMSDYELEAIYTFLSAIPCISHAATPGLPANIYQTCP